MVDSPEKSHPARAARAEEKHRNPAIPAPQPGGMVPGEPDLRKPMGSTSVSTAGESGAPVGREEKAELEEWLCDKENRNLFDQQRKLWESADDLRKMKSINKKKAFNNSQYFLNLLLGKITNFW